MVDHHGEQFCMIGLMTTLRLTSNSLWHWRANAVVIG